jgi:WD40 repeat protein/tRNA A-37 threonylcarbamoyl transferase component Bud32
MGEQHTPAQLVEVVRADRRARWQRGERVPAEEYLARYPALQADVTCAVELVYHEVLLREELGEAPQVGEYLQRFPQYRSRLEPLFEVHRALEDRHLLDTSVIETSPLATPSAAGGAPAAQLPAVAGHEVLSVLGRGGMGVVYKARQLSLNRLVALKMILAGSQAGPEETARFLREAETIALVKHPHVVEIHEFGTHEGKPYFSLEYLEGGSLADRLKGEPQPPLQAAKLVAMLAGAVQAAHERGIVHRDLKPANVLLAADGTPKVTDFGLAKQGDSGKTATGQVLGTPSYMAPEQALGNPQAVGAAADVYALGAILYEMLTGRPPFRGASDWDTLQMVVGTEPVAPCRLQPKVPRDLETICLKCLEKDPARRYATAQDLAEDLGRFADGRPIVARPVGRLERVAKWARRRPELATLAVLLVFVFLAGFAGVCWQWGRAEREWGRAEGEYRNAVEFAQAERATAYARAIALAHAEWRAGNAGSAKEILGTCPNDLRGWEWHYLKRLFQARQVATLDGGAGDVRAVAFSPDGARLASAGADGTVRVWDRQAAKEILTLRGPDDAIAAVAFSPDGQCLAAGTAAGTLRVWDAAQGKEVVTWRGHAAGVTGLAFDSDGRRLASTGKGEWNCVELKLWDPTDGKPLAGAASPNILAAVAFSPNGRRLVTAGHDEVVAMWDASTLHGISNLKGRNRWAVPWSSVAYSADGGLIAAGSPAGLVRVWDAATAQELFSAVTPSQTGVSGLAFSGRDARFLAAATTDNTIQGWSAKTGKPAFTLRGHRRAVTAVAWSLDGGCLASASQDRTVKLWNLGNPDEALTLQPPNQGITGVTFSRDGARLAVSTRDSTLQVLAAETWKPVFTLTRLPGTVSAVVYSPDSDRLASAEAAGTVRLREASDGREIFALPCGGSAVHAVAFSPDGGRLTAGAEDGIVRVWEVPAGREIAVLRCSGAVHAVAFSPDGGRLAAAGDEGVVHVWDATSGRELPALGRPDEPVYAVAFSPDGRRLATAGRDEAIRIWDSAGGLVRTLRGHAGAVRCLAYGPGERLASAGDDGVVKLWDAAGRELLTLRGHTGAVRAVAFRRDGRRLASGGDDRTIKVWDATPLEEMNARKE